MKFNSPLVSADWLNEHLQLESLVILDASVSKVGSGSDVLDENECIPRSRFFDMNTAFSDMSARFPNTIPTISQFEMSARSIGINQDSLICVYDKLGIYSSPRVWWLFKLMGFNNIAVLNGGFPAWTNAGFEIAKEHSEATQLGDFAVKFRKKLLVNFDAVTNAPTKISSIIIDARSSERFKGLQPEPRKGLKSGHIPNSINIPYTEVLNGSFFKNNSKLKALFGSKIDNDDHLIFSCGSGITACIVALAADCAGFTNYSVYDGSWTEYGTLTANNT